VHFLDVAAWPLLHLNLQNLSIFKVVQKVKNRYARAVRAPQCTNLVVLPRTLLPLVGPFRNLQVLLRSYSHLRGRFVHGHFSKAPIILVLHVEEQRRKCDMAWAEFFYSVNIPFAAARSTSFKKAVKMMSEMRRSYLPPSYHDIHKRFLNETKHKIKAQIAERTKMFIRTYGATLAKDG
jgi:hypothetical protein